MNRFLSTKNSYTVAILWFIVIGMIILLGVGLKKEHLTTLPIVLLSLVIALVVWTLLDTRYVMTRHADNLVPLLHEMYERPVFAEDEIEKFKKLNTSRVCTYLSQ